MLKRSRYAQHKRRRLGSVAVRIAVLTSILTLAVPAAAQRASPAALRVTVNHATVFTLAAAPAIVLIADPLVADIINERDNLVFVLGRKPGTTNLLAFDAAGHRLLDREVVVVPETADTVTVTRETDQTDYTCAPRCAFLAHLSTQGAAPSEIGATSAPATAAPSAGAASTAPGAPSRPLNP